MIDESELKRLLSVAALRGGAAAAAFERVYRLTSPVLLGVALKIVRRRELAEEVLHDAFVKIWRNLDSFDPHGTAIGWMSAIVRNRALDLIESHDMSRVDSYHDTTRSSHLDSIDDNPEASLDRLFDWGSAEGADQSLARKRAAAVLRGCLGELDAPERQSLVLAYEHGLSHGDLAVHLQRPLGTVKTWVRRGMEHLKRCVERCGGAAT
ncbi:MAG: sigma-70 family RNA polymerase sigma factor [Proteobacteria bacterium]|nr:sigma-70 family RNA polymerase sigma factor [Burkholderiales bacterium]